MIPALVQPRSVEPGASTWSLVEDGHNRCSIRRRFTSAHQVSRPEDGRKPRSDMRSDDGTAFSGEDPKPKTLISLAVWWSVAGRVATAQKFSLRGNNSPAVFTHEDGEVRSAKQDGKPWRATLVGIAGRKAPFLEAWRWEVLVADVALASQEGRDHNAREVRFLKVIGLAWIILQPQNTCQRVL